MLNFRVIVSSKLGSKHTFSPKKCRKESIKVKSKIPPERIPLNFWLMNMTPEVIFYYMGQKLK